jgi:heat shock protein HtpX
LYEQVSANIRNSYFLVIVFILVLAALGYLFGYLTGSGPFGLAIAIVIATVLSFSSYYYSDKLVLSMSRARPVTKEEFPYLFNTVEGLSIAAGLPAPKPYVIEDSAPNAFATGRDPEHASVAVTTGLLEKMNRSELEGVLAHEMSHIKNFDIRFMSLVTVLVGTVALLSDWLIWGFRWGGRGRSRDRDGSAATISAIVGFLLAILAPLIAQLIQLAISRQREYLADADAALLTRYPPGLANALRKLASDKEPLGSANKATAHLYIINPLKEHASRINNLFDTHPPIEERIKRLEEM